MPDQAQPDQAQSEQTRPEQASAEQAPITGFAGLEFKNGFDGLIGLQYTELTPDRVRAQWVVKPDLHQPMGLVHGGVYCAVIESVASVAGAVWFGQRGTCVGVNNNTDFLRAVREGTLYAEGTPLHRGRAQQLWQVTITDEHRRAVAIGKVRLQNLASGTELAR